MKLLSNFVSLHPYFKVHPGKIEAFKAGFAAFVEKTANEEKRGLYRWRDPPYAQAAAAKLPTGVAVNGEQAPLMSDSESIRLLNSEL